MRLSFLQTRIISSRLIMERKTKESKPRKIGFNFRTLFRLAIVVGAFYFLTRLLDSGVSLVGIGLVAFGVIGLVVRSRIKHRRPDSFEYFSLPEIIQMKMPGEWQSVYESTATFLIGSRGSGLFAAGWFLLIFVMIATRRRTILGLSLDRVIVAYFFGWILLTIIGSFLGWEEMAEREQREHRMKPIPERGEKIELYDVETRQPLAHISSAELQFLIDSFQEWGMADNDFFIMRETVDLFEDRGAEAHLVATLKEMLGKKDEIEIGWTLI
jgi:hypothetical protein